MKVFLTRIIPLVLLLTAFCRFGAVGQRPVFEMQASAWVDSLMDKLTLDQRIGQLFMVAAYSNKDAAHEAELKKLVSQYGIGGLIFFQGGPVRQAALTNRLQAAAKVPLMIGMDAEWGLAMRLDSTIRFQRQMTLGAIKNDSLIYAFGAEVARECRRLGVHINFAPVVDINNNPANPVIGTRSFGQDPQSVIRKSAMYIKGMQDHGVLANAKHFPGHGDTDTDSHLALPVIKHDKVRLSQIELSPYKPLFDIGLASVMVAHLSVPALDSAKNRASTLSPQIVRQLLRGDLGFQGLIFTDALNMKGVSAQFAPGDVDLLAAQAGNDVLLFAEDVPKAVARLKAAIADGTYTEAAVNASVRRILQAKAWLGLPKERPIEIRNLHKDLNTPEALVLKKKLAEASITLVHNTDNLLPLKRMDQYPMGLVTIGGDGSSFEQELKKSARFRKFNAAAVPTAEQVKQISTAFTDTALIVLQVIGTQSPAKNFGFSNEAAALIEKLAIKHKVVLVLQTCPYALKALKSVDGLAAIVVAYQDDNFQARAAVAAISGAVGMNGTLPVAVGNQFALHAGLTASVSNRLEWSSPVEMGFKPTAFDGIDSIVKEGIAARAYPGAQVLVAQNGKVIYDKCFGYHTYENAKAVAPEDLYDLASITKIAATTLSLMKLQDEGKFDLDKPIRDYLPQMPDSSAYSELTPRQMLAHVAGFKAWIPFSTETITKEGPLPGIYSNKPSEVYSKRVARDFYIRQSYSDSMLYRILKEPLDAKKDYKYSDLGYYFMRLVVEKLSGETIDQYAQRHFYEPMGLGAMTYRPLEKFSPKQIVPTEYDASYRKQLVHGDVHDQGAAMQGGVGGHAGLFGNAESLAAIMQMLLNGGTYGGERYLSEAVISEYTRCQFCVDQNDKKRRGAGFDKPVIPPGPGPTCKCVSFDSFGHTGFTGTMAWADPKEQTVYIFLSNRIYPSAENKKLAQMDIRSRVQEEIYRAIAMKGNDSLKSRFNP